MVELIEDLMELIVLYLNANVFQTDFSSNLRYFRVEKVMKRQTDQKPCQLCPSSFT